MRACFHQIARGHHHPSPLTTLDNPSATFSTLSHTATSPHSSSRHSGMPHHCMHPQPLPLQAQPPLHPPRVHLVQRIRLRPRNKATPARAPPLYVGVSARTTAVHLVRWTTMYAKTGHSWLMVAMHRQPCRISTLDTVRAVRQYHTNHTWCAPFVVVKTAAPRRHGNTCQRLPLQRLPRG